MAGRDEIIDFLDDLLDSPAFDDYGPNGLQVPGAEEVRLVVSGVSAHRELFEAARDAGAQMVLCHHGIFWRGAPLQVTPQSKERLKVLFDSDISLAAYHLPLDAHPEVGNNALICRALGFERQRSFDEHGGRDIGSIARNDTGLPAAKLFARCAELFGQEPLVFDAGADAVHTIGVVSGGGSRAISEAAALGADAFITGEPSEFVMADARELGVHYIAGGHWATETFGVRRLGELLAERFGVEHRFIAVPNPI
ncbi:MAG TPA: Nif3-like dinuclear metal center hexameric protein [Thermoleophilaceae bacterium]